MLDFIFKFNAASDGILKDFCDEQLYEDNNLFCSDPHALQLFIYYDDVESGVEFIIKGNKCHLKGTLCRAIAENLASQALSWYKCEDLLFKNAEFEPRTKETHSHHICLLQGPLHDQVSTTYGITRDTALYKINNDVSNHSKPLTETYFSRSTKKMGDVDHKSEFD
uniref:Uncharacterized protein n=1 Tax=Amphimedon queenslandica TaxID=400682 RepID=A0A1X7VR95_AMPQE